jgi:uncharacterized protein involved in exopolysaccharide biosynthesis
MSRLGWKRWILTATVIGAAVGLIAAARTPNRYRSEALIRVRVESVPETSARSSDAPPLSVVLQLSVGQDILSRTRLERLIGQFDLYPDERRHWPMETVVEQMRKDVVISPQGDDSLRVGFVGTEPRTVMRVAERLTALFIQEAQQDREVLVKQTHEFIWSQELDVRRRLITQKQQLGAARKAGSAEAETLAIESEALEATFKDLLSKLEDSQRARDLDRRQKGQWLSVIEVARLPEPLSPDRRLYAGGGAALGLVIGCLLWTVVMRTRSKRPTARQSGLAEA